MPDVAFDETAHLDLRNIDTWALGYDLWLIRRTVGTELPPRGAVAASAHAAGHRPLAVLDG